MTKIRTSNWINITSRLQLAYLILSNIGGACKTLKCTLVTFFWIIAMPYFKV